MKTIRLHYDSQSGCALGYYPSDVVYKSMPTPYIEITDLEYQSMLGKEHEFRVNNKQLENISETPEYLIAECNRLYIQSIEKINSLAVSACKCGVITVDESHNINVRWKDYYEILKKAAKEVKTLKIKVYDDSFKEIYKDFSSAEAEELLAKFISAIDLHASEYVPKKQAEYLTQLELLNKEADNLKPAKLKSFYDSIEYGLQIL